ncbi:MAG: class I SAM-dependent methyltransferase [Nitrospirae bacterium]|nr:class I SAM-dependent methyltransferase [Nitrospirota bacterium]MDA1305390.1 class I SAM-dependent methyltransferase [Nitrospirota bacterium]
MCPLCHTCKIDTAYHQDNRRNFYSCETCQLVFVPPEQFLSEEEENAAYDHHQNSPDDQGYRSFLSRLFIPMNQRLAPGSQGLDFGSGPGPTLSKMFEEAGHSVALFDYFYANDQSVLQPAYDFITASEVVEHLHHPKDELERLWNILNPGGILGIMTKRVLNREAFATWHYKNDLTHVCFFSEFTFQWLAGQWQAELTIVGNDVVLLKKIVAPSP